MPTPAQNLLALMLLAGSTLSAITVTVNSTSPTQAILSYAAASTDACTVEVSESSSYTPLVHDVDGNLFPGANLDSRAGTLISGTYRILLVGTRSIQTASDSSNYSRALQQNTLHYYRVTCNGQVTTGTFTTKILPFGATYQDLMPLNVDGTYNFPTTSATNRSEVIVDSQTGVILKRINLPSDNGPNSAPFPTYAGFGESCSATLTAQGNYHCMFNDYPQGIYPNLYSIDPITGEAQFLGAAYFYPSSIDPQGLSISGVSGGGERVMWDQSDANTAYVPVRIVATGRSTIVKWTYFGQDNPAGNIAVTPQQSPATVVDMLGSTSSTLGSDLNALAQAYAIAHGTSINTSLYPCGFSELQSHYVAFTLLGMWQPEAASGGGGVYDLGNGLPLGSGGNGQVVALTPMWQEPGARWCTQHTDEFLGNVPIFSIAVDTAFGSGTGMGPYLSALNGGMDDSQTSLVLTSSWTFGGSPPTEDGPLGSHCRSIQTTT